MATLSNFITDPVVADNGLPNSPGAPQTIGRINLGVDVDGNAIEAVDEQDLRYFNGKYYLYGQSFSCGSFHYAAGTSMAPLLWTDEPSFYRYCGLAIYSSDDLMNWKLLKREVFRDPSTGQAYMTKKPRVVYSPKTGLYTMWFLGESGRRGIPLGSEVYFITQSTSPTGPWGPVRKPTSESDPTLNSIGPDFTINTAPDGTDWLVTSHAGIKVFKLNDEKTGTVDQIDINLAANTMGGGIGIHHNNGWWYITASNGCGNCISAKLYYLMARDPRGPWLSPGTGQSDLPLQPMLLAEEVGRSQVHGVVMLPDSSGKTHALVPSTHYRSSPSGAPTNDPAQPGDNNLALSGHFYFPLSYSADGHILPLALNPVEQFPLARPVEAKVRPTYEAVLHITANQSVTQSWDVRADQTIAAVLPSVFQRTPDPSPIGLARGNPVPQDAHVNAPLLARLQLPDGTVQAWTIDPRTVAWAPKQVPLNLSVPFRGAGKMVLTLSTTGSNGGYGVAVGEKSEELPGGEYATTQAGQKTVSPRAQMLLRTSESAIAAPAITVQPQSVVARAGTTIGFDVRADGIGVGYQWSKNSQVIIAPDGQNETTALSLRLPSVTAAESGTYTVTVFNQTGSVTSVPVTLEVVP